MSRKQHWKKHRRTNDRDIISSEQFYAIYAKAVKSEQLDLLDDLCVNCIQTHPAIQEQICNAVVVGALKSGVLVPLIT